jgi:hypothetical protein
MGTSAGEKKISSEIGLSDLKTGDNASNPIWIIVPD